MNYAEFIADVGAIGDGPHDVRVGPRPPGKAPARSGPTTCRRGCFTHADLEPIEGADVRFAQGDVRPVHAEMVEAAGDKDVWVIGGGDLAAQFAEAGLLDRVMVSIAPVTLGAGRPLFPRKFDLRLAEVARNSAFVCATYDVVGPRAS